MLWSDSERHLGGVAGQRYNTKFEDGAIFLKVEVKTEVEQQQDIRNRLSDGRVIESLEKVRHFVVLPNDLQGLHILGAL